MNEGTIKCYFKIMASKIELLNLKIDQIDLERNFLEIKSNRDSISEKLYEVTFGTFFIVLTWRTIEMVLNLNSFSKKVFGVLILFLCWGIFFILNKIRLIKIDKRIEIAKKAIKDGGEDLKQMHKKQEEIEDKI
jgi:hypothetical protein